MFTVSSNSVWSRGYKKGGERVSERDEADSVTEPNPLLSVCLKDGRGASCRALLFVLAAADICYKGNLL